jgi:hypothetical protein
MIPWWQNQDDFIVTVGATVAVVITIVSLFKIFLGKRI